MRAWQLGWFGAAVAVLAILIMARFATAQDGTPGALPMAGTVMSTPAAGTVTSRVTSGFVGSWRVDPTILGQVNPALTTFTNDGSVFTSNRPVQPGPPGLTDRPIAQSLGHGAWEVTGERTANVTFEFIQTDLTGTFLGFRVIRGSLELNEGGDEWTGRFTFTITDAAGATVQTGEGTVVAQRINAEAPVLGTPPA